MHQVPSTQVGVTQQSTGHNCIKEAAAKEYLRTMVACSRRQRCNISIDFDGTAR